MKKTSLIISVLVVMVVGMVSFACATPKYVPLGTVVSATVDTSTMTAHVTISGVTPVNVEFYSYEGKVSLGAVNEFNVNLREGRRFNFTFNEDGNTWYALVDPTMATPPAPDFFGDGIGMDCSYVENGQPKCTFLIAGQ